MTSNMGVLNNEKRDTHEKMIMMMVSVFVLLSLAACHSVENGNNADEPLSGSEVQSDYNEQTDPSMENVEAEEGGETIMDHSMKITIGETTLTATLEDNSSAEALVEKLKEGDLTLDLEDYGNMEKVGGLGFSLPRNDRQIRTQAGDLILYQGDAFVIYYDTNSWNFTRLGKIDDVTGEELKEILGNGDVTVVLSLN